LTYGVSYFSVGHYVPLLKFDPYGIRQDRVPRPARDGHCPFVETGSLAIVWDGTGSPCAPDVLGLPMVERDSNLSMVRDDELKGRPMKKIHATMLACALALSITASTRCEKGAGAAGNPDGGAPTGAKAAPAVSKVAKIVFVDQEECCDCTRKRIDDSWAALQEALKGRSPVIPIERVHQDKESDKAEGFRLMKPYMVVPAVYLLDAGDALVEQLQGELTADQFKKALR